MRLVFVFFVALFFSVYATANGLFQADGHASVGPDVDRKTAAADKGESRESEKISKSFHLGYSLLERLEKDASSKVYELKPRNAFYLGYSYDGYLYDAFKFQLQYSSDDMSSQNGNVRIDVNYHEVMLWAKYRTSYQLWGLSYFGGLGLGATWNEADSTLGSQTVSDKSTEELVFGLVTEALYSVNEHVSIGFDAKLIYSRYYSQKPTIEVGLLNLTYYF